MDVELVAWRLDEAEVIAEQIGAVAELVPIGLHVGEARRAWASVHRTRGPRLRLGDRAAPCREVGLAHDAFVDCGAKRLAARAARELRRPGVKPGPAQAADAPPRRALAR